VAGLPLVHWASRGSPRPEETPIEALALAGSFVVSDFGRPRGRLQWVLFSVAVWPTIFGTLEVFGCQP
jgi:hypothetical protein